MSTEAVIKADYVVPATVGGSIKMANVTLQKVTTNIASHPVISSTATGINITGSQLGSFVLHAPTAAATVTLPTVTDMATRFALNTVGDSVSFMYLNQNATSATHQFVSSQTVATLLPSSATATSSSAALFRPTFVVTTTGTSGVSDLRGSWLF